MDSYGDKLTHDETAVLDHVTGLTPILASPKGAICEDREAVGDLMAMRVRLGALAIRTPKMKLQFGDVTASASRMSAQPPDKSKGFIYRLSSRWGLGLLSAATICLAILVGAFIVSVNRDVEVYSKARMALDMGLAAPEPEKAIRRAVQAEDPSDDFNFHTSKITSTITESPLPASGDIFDLGPSAALIRSGSISLTHEDPGSIQGKVTDLVTAAGGMVTNLTRQGTGDETTIELQVAIPSDKYRSVIGKIAAFGKVVAQQEQTADATGAIIDYDARLAESQSYLKRLDDLASKKAGNLTELQNLERERRQTRLEIERYRRSLASLKSRVAMSQLTVSVFTQQTEEPEPEQEELGPFEEAWEDGTTGLGKFLAFILKAGLAGSPLLFVGFIAWLVIRRRRPLETQSADERR